MAPKKDPSFVRNFSAKLVSNQLQQEDITARNRSALQWAAKSTAIDKETKGYVESKDEVVRQQAIQDAKIAMVDDMAAPHTIPPPPDEPILQELMKLAASIDSKFSVWKEEIWQKQIKDAVDQLSAQTQNVGKLQEELDMLRGKAEQSDHLNRQIGSLQQQLGALRETETEWKNRQQEWEQEKVGWLTKEQQLESEKSNLEQAMEQKDHDLEEARNEAAGELEKTRDAWEKDTKDWQDKETQWQADRKRLEEDHSSLAKSYAEGAYAYDKELQRQSNEKIAALHDRIAAFEDTARMHKEEMTALKETADNLESARGRHEAECIWEKERHGGTARRLDVTQKLNIELENEKHRLRIDLTNQKSDMDDVSKRLAQMKYDYKQEKSTREILQNKCENELRPALRLERQRLEDMRKRDQEIAIRARRVIEMKKQQDGEMMILREKIEQDALGLNKLRQDFRGSQETVVQLEKFIVLRKKALIRNSRCSDKLLEENTQLVEQIGKDANLMVELRAELQAMTEARGILGVEVDALKKQLEVYCDRIIVIMREKKLEGEKRKVLEGAKDEE
ncbi:ATP-dependent RNA helicase [Venturia inaequalis]|nr:ATP-dependent RNA helicase [Venturia inaequalis]